MKILLSIFVVIFLIVGAKANTGDYKVFSATAYTIKGRTAKGTRTRKGIIAADRKILPLGTRVHIEGMGEFVVEDTGGAIKGHRVDIWLPTKAHCRKFGRRKVRLKIL